MKKYICVGCGILMLLLGCFSEIGSVFVLGMTLLFIGLYLCNENIDSISYFYVDKKNNIPQFTNESVRNLKKLNHPEIFYYDPDTILGDAFLCKKVMRLKIPLIKIVQFTHHYWDNGYTCMYDNRYKKLIKPLIEGLKINKYRCPSNKIPPLCGRLSDL